VGLASYPVDSEDGLELVDRADRAMYLGKQQGGNRVSVSPGTTTHSPFPSEMRHQLPKVGTTS